MRQEVVDSGALVDFADLITSLKISKLYQHVLLLRFLLTSQYHVFTAAIRFPFRHVLRYARLPNAH
jgi:hypothetical protein